MIDTYDKAPNFNSKNPITGLEFINPDSEYFDVDF